jgi:hypothetical protein
MRRTMQDVIDEANAEMRRNPPAFPQSAEIYGGMTLRDYFAGGVAAALCSATDSAGTWMAPLEKSSAYIIADRAYAIADAMLAARQEPSA